MTTNQGIEMNIYDEIKSERSRQEDACLRGARLMTNNEQRDGRPSDSAIARAFFDFVATTPHVVRGNENQRRPSSAYNLRKQFETAILECARAIDAEQPQGEQPAQGVPVVAIDRLRYALKMYDENRTTMQSLASSVKDFLCDCAALAASPAPAAVPAARLHELWSCAVMKYLMVKSALEQCVEHADECEGDDGETVFSLPAQVVNDAEEAIEKAAEHGYEDTDLAAIEESITSSPAVDAPKLWCLHIQGIDDVHAAPSYAHAKRAADDLNQRVNGVTKTPLYADVIEWPHSAESHAEDVGKFVEQWLAPAWAVKAAPAAVPEDGENISMVAKTAPERIWLQVDTSGDSDEAFPPPPYEGVTWCDVSIGGEEVEYVRADLASRQHPNCGYGLRKEVEPSLTSADAKERRTAAPGREGE